MPYVPKMGTPPFIVYRGGGGILACFSRGGGGREPGRGFYVSRGLAPGRRAASPGLWQPASTTRLQCAVAEGQDVAGEAPRTRGTGGGEGVAGWLGDSVGRAMPFHSYLLGGEGKYPQKKKYILSGWVEGRRPP